VIEKEEEYLDGGETGEMKFLLEACIGDLPQIIDVGLEICTVETELFVPGGEGQCEGVYTRE
jgi:hypothetical protein